MRGFRGVAGHAAPCVIVAMVSGRSCTSIVRGVPTMPHVPEVLVQGATRFGAHNRKHLFVDHVDRGITEAQVTYVVENATDDNIAPDPRHGRTIALCRIGRRVLSVAWLVRPRGGCYPVHAHWAGRRESDSLNE
jgi:hypothetical protein